jgi:hypothetical protein
VRGHINREGKAEKGKRRKGKKKRIIADPQSSASPLYAKAWERGLRRTTLTHHKASHNSFSFRQRAIQQFGRTVVTNPYLHRDRLQALVVCLDPHPPVFLVLVPIASGYILLILRLA